jgi:hypothetical protein
MVVIALLLFKYTKLSSPICECKFLILTKTTKKKSIKISSIICTLVILGLSLSHYRTSIAYGKSEKENIKIKIELKETEEVLEQCSDRYYQQIIK